MKWQPISELTDANLDLAGDGRLILSNPCNGPFMPRGVTQYACPEEVQLERTWTHFLVIPDNPADWPPGYVE